LFIYFILKRFLVVQNLKIAESSVFIFSKLFALALINPLFLLTFSPDECQSKSFEKMNTLLSAIFILFCPKVHSRWRSNVFGVQNFDFAEI